ncbi:MAG: ribbon-helix-helix protein, CopG family [Acidimicrobiia bacterium]|nr:ribbon-helix-helix protein, CopG family [Acidimicrobiia bacterium]
MSQQLAVRIPDDMADRLTDLVAEGRYPSVAAAIRSGIQELIERRDAHEIDQQIVEGYRRVPPTDTEEVWAEKSGRELIAEEPW